MYNKRLHKVSHQTEFKSGLFDKVYYANIDDIVGYMRRAYLGITTTSGDELRFYNVTVMSKTESYDQELRTALNNDTSSISAISIPDTVTAINDMGLNFAWYVKNVTIPASVEVFGEEADAGTNMGVYLISYEGDGPELESIEFLGPDTKLNYACLFHSTSLISVTLPSNLTIIPEDCFYDCFNLSSIEIPSTVQKIGYGAFNSCNGLTSITIPDSVTSIEYGTFRFCDSLTSITIPDSVTSIGNEAFEGCDSLSFITIPNSVTSIGISAFNGCKSLSSITIPDSVTSIENSAFNGCKSLSSITIPDSVTSIGNNAFYECNSLTSITIPDSVTSIGNNAFERCTNLTAIYYSGTASGAPWMASNATVISNP